MTLTIAITPEIESQLHAAASKSGLAPNDFVVSVLRQRLLQTQKNIAPHLSERESSLLHQINQGLPDETWTRYRELIKKRNAHELTPEEQSALIDISDEIEELNASRIQNLSDLALLRGISLPDLMKELGMDTPQPV